MPYGIVLLTRIVGPNSRSIQLQSQSLAGDLWDGTVDVGHRRSKFCKFSRSIRAGDGLYL